MGCTRCPEIECCIDGWSDGTLKESNWGEERYEVHYRSHINSLKNLRNHSHQQQGGDLLTHIQHDLLKGARWVFPLSIMCTFIDTLLTTLEAHTRVSHLIL
jgi:hypothetical protein